MVDVSIHIEGDNSRNNEQASTFSSAPSLRQAFSELFSKEVDPEKIRLIVDTYGSVNRTKKLLEKTMDQQDKALFLIDLDTKKDNKEKRLADNYNKEDYNRIFFMIQRMEAWIISQPEAISKFAIKNNLRFRKTDISLINFFAIDENPEDIPNPDDRIKVQFKRAFEVSRKGRVRKRSYSKSKDAPELIRLLNTELLRQIFDEFDSLINKIQSSI